MLCLDGNALVALPDAVSNATALCELQLGGNALTDLPSYEPLLCCVHVHDRPRALATLPRLHTLNAANNQLHSVPSVLANAPSLKHLNIRYGAAWTHRSCSNADCVVHTHSANPLDDALRAAASSGMSAIMALLQQRMVAEHHQQASMLRPVGESVGSSTRFVLNNDLNPPPEAMLSARRAAQGPLTLEGPLGRCMVAQQQVFVPVHPDVVVVVGAWAEEVGEEKRTPRGAGPPLCVLRTDTMTWLSVVRSTFQRVERNRMTMPVAGPHRARSSVSARGPVGARPPGPPAAALWRPVCKRQAGERPALAAPRELDVEPGGGAGERAISQGRGGGGGVERHAGRSRVCWKYC